MSYISNIVFFFEVDSCFHLWRQGNNLQICRETFLTLSFESWETALTIMVKLNGRDNWKDKLSYRFVKNNSVLK